MVFKRLEKKTGEREDSTMGETEKLKNKEAEFNLRFSSRDRVLGMVSRIILLS